MVFFLSIALTFVLGFAFCHLILLNVRSIHIRLLINLSLPIGIGISSVIFIFFNLLGLSHWLIFFIEILAAIFFLVKFNYTRQNTIHYQFERFSLNKLLLTPLLFITMLLYAYSLIIDIGIFFFESVHSPHGLWDAWSCWNIIARFIARAPNDWPALLHQMNAIDFHPDYPLLQRGFIAHRWLLIGNETVWIPILTAFVFCFCTIGLLTSSISVFTQNKTDGLIAGLIMLCTPFYMVMGFSQYADNTVGYFYLATIVLLTLARKTPSVKPNILIAAGVTSSLAAWSKNEGLMFILCIFASQLTRLFFCNCKILLQELKYIFIGILPILLLVLYQKFFIAPTNQIVAAQGSETFVKLQDFGRYEVVWGYFKEKFTNFGAWITNPWWLFLIGIIIKGGINFKDYNFSVISNFTWLLLMTTGFFFVEIITPLGLHYYLSTSLHRLFFQLFPSFLFIYFMAINGQHSIAYEKRVNAIFQNIFQKIKFTK